MCCLGVGFQLMGEVHKLFLASALIDTRHIEIILFIKEFVDKIRLTDAPSSINGHEFRP